MFDSHFNQSQSTPGQQQLQTPATSSLNTPTLLNFPLLNFDMNYQLQFDALMDSNNVNQWATTPLMSPMPQVLTPFTMSQSIPSSPILMQSPQAESQSPLVPPASPTSSNNKRFRATPQELEYLLNHFETNPFPDFQTRAAISAKLKISEKQVLVWFQNRRATLKTNGIVAVRPKRLNVGGGSVGCGGSSLISGLSFKKAKKSGSVSESTTPMTPLSGENPFFFVVDSK
ncbi:UNVERIFIED_CONTAM: hypothetical protein HDU68_011347 [Siphonaria sp. JEL0065]|nr:hypothetical protein HDU68_011347 [Siphonaria sp. JEL0065]